MITSEKCNKVIISDISAKCLSKAEKLLANELANGTAVKVVSDGLKDIPYADTVLIAGMGGQEIISIIKSAPFYPEKLILQPMKNTDLVRVEAVKLGYKIIKDFVFLSSGIFYDLIILEKGDDNLSQEEIEFGRTNIKDRHEDFIKKIKWQIQKIKGYIESGKLSESDTLKMQERIKNLEKYVQFKRIFFKTRRNSPDRVFV
jgi:tRNA (adenine22-N1)-methyltransferase